MLAMLRPIDPLSADPEQIDAARLAIEVLSRSDACKGVRVEAQPARAGEAAQSVILPAQAVRLLTDILGHIAEGRSVSILPSDATLTTSQAADLLNVSRPYFVRLLDQDEIPYTKVGTHRRIALPDLVAYREKRRARSRAAVDELVEQAQELDMGY